jgi:nitroimidazol reductase NimA-like FMN-containing flavoprotein (pyridoxamine 5'-phosphate oxidase superfamily)
MMELMKKLLRENHLCVLATCANNVPHCSLMTYATNAAADRVYLITRRDSRKYANLTGNPQVSLLVDTRGSGNAARAEDLKALTVAGEVTPVADQAERQAVLDMLVEQYPHLRELAQHPAAEPLAVTVKSFLLLDGVQNASYEALS